MPNLPGPIVKSLWLWRNGDHFWAFDNPFPCYPNGDPMTLGEPSGTAMLFDSIDASKHKE